MSFASPLWLFGLLALPLLAIGEGLLARRDASRIARVVSRTLWTRVVTRPAAGWRYARLTLLLIGTAGLVLALARPEWGIVREKVEREGVDVVLALDSSGSMATEDVSPSRFFIARNALMALVGDLEGDRIGLLAFEGEAYPLVPLTLDADAVGLFLETLEPGIVPAPGSSLGVGLAKGLDLFVDQERRNKALVLVSDGEDLEGDVEDAIKRAKEAGVVVHAVGVGTERGQPVPDFDREGKRTGFKKDESGSVVVSRLHADTLEAIARGTGGTYVALSAAHSSLAGVAAAIEGMERKTLAREWSYRKRERYQIPLGVALAAFTLALLLPPFPLRRARALAKAAVVVVAALGASSAAAAEPAKVAGEVLLRPKRLTQQARQQFEQGNHPAALQAFEKAAASRPDDPAARFNLADGLYKNGKFDEAAALYDALGGSGSPLAPAARFNLGNARFQKQDYKGAIESYKDALRMQPGNAEAMNNLELALKALQKQQQEQKKKQDQQKDDSSKDQEQQRDQQSKEQQKPKPDQKPSDPKQDQPPDRPKTEEEKEKERYQKETGMPKERAMQLLDALQQNEKDEQKRLLAAKQSPKKTAKDW
jgi:Ca-activated chloride channel homolog